MIRRKQGPSSPERQGEEDEGRNCSAVYDHGRNLGNGPVLQLLGTRRVAA